jgi:hypothetical protein
MIYLLVAAMVIAAFALAIHWEAEDLALPTLPDRAGLARSTEATATTATSVLA